MSMPEDQRNEDQTQSFVPLTKGTEIGHYKIISKIGAGGMGEVYLAEDTQLDRKVALKFLPPHLSQDEAARARFTREAKAAAKLDHPNIVQVFEVGEFQGRPFFAMAHIEGKSLRDAIKEGKLSINMTIELIKQICEGLHKAHESGVVHRDIKPGNIIIDDDNKARILDFGLATVAGEDKLTKTGSTLGTVGYMSPEQIEGKQVDHRSDIFSVGVMLYEMLTGRRPFDGETDAAVGRAITDTKPEPIARYKSGTTGELQQIVDKALTKAPALRYQHADGMLADLKQLSIESGATKKRRIGLVVAAVTFIALVTGYFGFSTFHRESDQVAGPKRLVVLPFENLGGDDQDYFASGMTDEVISRLSNIRDLAVISRNTAARLKGEGLGIDEIGKKLGVEYVLDASARYQESSEGHRRVRLVIQLINVTEDRVVWSQSYDTIMTEVFAVQANIAESVAEKMDIILQGPEREQLRTRWTDNEEAYDLLLRAWQVDYNSKEGMYAGLKMLKRAVELDSGFVVAQANLADFYGRLYAFFTMGEDTLKDLCWKTAELATQLSDHYWAKNWPLARYYYLCEKEYDKALEYLDKAYDGNRNHIYYLMNASWMNIRAGRWQEGYSMYRRVIELEPTETSRYSNLAWMDWYMRNYPEAIDNFRRYLTMYPQSIKMIRQLAQVYVEWKADTEASRDVMREFSSTADTTSTMWQNWLLQLDVFEQEYDQAMERLHKLNYNRSSPPYLDLAWIYRGLGDTALAYIYADSGLKWSIRDVEANPDLYNYYGALAWNYALLMDKANTMKAWDKRIELMPLSRDAGSQKTEGIVNLVMRYALWGETEIALAYLDTLLSVPSSVGLGSIFLDHDMKKLVEHEGFLDIMNKHADTAQWRVYNELIKSDDKRPEI